MKRITLFTREEIQRLADGDVVEGVDHSGFEVTYVSEQRYIERGLTEPEIPEVTYQDILYDWMRNFPDLSPLLKDYRPAIEEYMSIIIWTDTCSYLYSYRTKHLRKIAR